MIGILNRWRQFGRRYFWPHLLLGMVAASLGLPTSLNESQELTPLANSASSVSRQNSTSLSLTDLVALKDAHRRSSFGVDYWHQHAIRTVIRHLSFALTAPQPITARQVDDLPSHSLVLLDTLSALLTREAKLPTIIRQTGRVSSFPPTHHQTGIWLAQVRGIRAGPHFPS
ncbi:MULTISPECIES: secA translation cis-regulator SecM [unclassified Brenneria]|uniref:secA translation cis-regulator SecM n=1 Tax=unclassified Brenneria TaxID=2634434 RepID=UPI001555DCA3|nr:secA regulator SecM [Brenneria sp. L3-3C-1]MEE3644118.1 secA translation cis-regulator SecM [Brenneria sp. L3_3C_1]MEE3651777.1 secA translation cis-regulator SecM [Brenneria sp. HEZEL_4_2_4]NPD01733.1 secA regulator SecM [Brenneria sp. hezel4-2-4]